MEDMNTELVCVMASLGYYDDDDYYKGADCMESLKDLIRFLRREDEGCNIRRQMGNAHLLQKDLLPMLIHLGDDHELMDIVVRLLVNLTSPADICFNKLEDNVEEVDKKEKLTNTFQTKYLEVVSYLQAYKKAFANEKTLAAVGAQLGRILQMEFEDRSEDELLLFERLLLLLRNVLHVPADPNEELRTDDDASLHDQVLWSMHMNGIDDLIIYVSSSPEEGRWTMHIIEIINLMLREQNPEKLAKTSQEKSESEKAEITRELQQAIEKDEALKKAAKDKMASTRHSRFGGAFWVMNMKGVGQTNALVHHKHVASPKDISFDEKKYPRRVPKRKQPRKECEVEKRSTMKMRIFLRDFCKKFLELSYNPMMKQIKDSVVTKHSQENDDTYYIWAMKFFMVFNRSHSFKVEFISETLNMNTFHYILKQINFYYDQIVMHKRGGWEAWAKRLHKALQAYKELLTYLVHMDKSPDDVLKDASAVIKNNIFYHEEYRSIFLVLLRHYVIRQHTKQFLADLIDTFHIFVKLLERFCTEKGSLLVKTQKKVSKKKKKQANTQNAPPQAMTAEQLEDLWENDVAPTLSGLLQGYEMLPTDVPSPFDPTSDVPLDEQRVNATIRIQDLLRSGESGEALALVRVCRECWPDEEKFGQEGSPPESEFLIFRNLLVAELERPVFEEEEYEQNDEENEEVEEEAASVRSVEREFHLKEFLFSLASPKMIMPYCRQLKEFKTNTSFTNHAIARMMHRVAVDMKFPEMFFQLSLFITFEELLTLKAGFGELAKFSQYIIYKFTQAAIENPDIYVETLFWKGIIDCYQISGRGDETKSSNKANKWTLEEEGELKNLYDQFKDSEDVVGEILKNISDADRTRKKITNKLVQMELVENAQALPNPERAAAGNWSYEQEEELKTLFDEHREAEDVVGEILKCLSGAFTRQRVTNKLVRLKLVDSAKQLPKPRKEKPNVWTEEQTEELFRLYDEFSETDDVLGNIILAMTSKKSKQAITKQLLETGKVQDRKMLRKKKKVEKQLEDDEPIYDNWSDESENDSKEMENKKKLQKKKNDKRFRNVWSESDASSSDNDADNDDDDNDDVHFDVDNDKENKHTKRDQHKANKHAKRGNPKKKVSIINLAQKAREDFKQQLVWLQSRLRRAADDREEDDDDDWYAIPLLTITEEDDMAMASKNFSRLLEAIGLRPPQDEQEMYWRIPENLTPTTLREFADELDKTADEFDKTIDELDKSVDELGKPSVALSDTMPEELNDTMSEELSDASPEVNSPPKAGSSITEAKKSSVSKRAKRRFAISDSDESADEDIQDGGGKKEELIQQRSAKRKRILDEDDDNDSSSDGENVDDAIPIHTLLSNIDKQREHMYDVMNTQDIDDSIPLNKLVQTNENTDSTDVSNTSPCGVLRDKTNLNLDDSEKPSGDLLRDNTNLDDSDMESNKGTLCNVSSSLNEVS